MNRYLELFDDNPPPTAEELEAAAKYCHDTLDLAEYLLLRARLRLAQDEPARHLAAGLRHEDDRVLASSLGRSAWKLLNTLRPHPGQEDRYHQLIGWAARAQMELPR